MEVNFSDFTTKRNVHEYLVVNSNKKIVKMETRILQENGVVSKHSDEFLDNCGDIKYYFDDDESLEINNLNHIALFIRADGENLIVEHIDDSQSEKSFLSLLNSELGLDFTPCMSS